MRKNLLGEYVVEPIDFANMIIEDFDKQVGIKFAPNPNRVKGFHYWNSSVFPRTDEYTQLIYCIYKDSEPVYVGLSKSKNGLYHRVGRFCCQLSGRTVKAGEHPGAKKYKKIYKEDYSNLYVKYAKIYNNQQHILLEDIEFEVIRILKPICNNQIYKRNWIEGHEARLKLS